MLSMCLHTTASLRYISVDTVGVDLCSCAPIALLSGLNTVEAAVRI